MACGCSDGCDCVITGAEGIGVTGDGSATNPYVVVPPAEIEWEGTNSDGGITITPGGTNGHAPVIDLNLDPASPSALSVSEDGLSVDCCVEIDPDGGIFNDTDGLSILIDPASTAPVSLSADGLLIDCCTSETIDPDGGLSEGPDGLEIIIDPASTAPVSVSATGLRVDCCAAPDSVTARAVRTSNQSIPNSTETLVTFQATDFDTDTIWNSSSRLIAPNTGFYLVAAGLDFAAAANPSVGSRYFMIRKNSGGSPAGGDLVALQSSSAAVFPTTTAENGSAIIQLNATEYVELFAFQDQGISINVLSNGSSFFSLAAI